MVKVGFCGVPRNPSARLNPVEDNLTIQTGVLGLGEKGMAGVLLVSSDAHL